MKVGFVSNLYFTPKGHSYVTEMLLRTVLEAGHEAHMYRIRDNPVVSEFVQPTTLKTCPDTVIPKEEFEKWLDEIQPEVCVFNEYSQWWDEDHDKVLICKERGIRTIGYLVLEKLDSSKVEHYKLYTHLICPTKFQQTLYREMGCYNTKMVPWGDYNDVYENLPEVRYGDKITFLHVAGNGGADNRKNTQKIIDAFKLIGNTDEIELKITHLQSKAFSRKEILGLMKSADVLINTSKWETLGLNTIEGNKLGIPVIVADGPPMNELVKNNYNGVCVKSEQTTSSMVTCPAWDIDVDSLINAIHICKNKDVLEFLKQSAKKYAETNFDWDKNKIAFLELLK